jgi:hypothetical protein
MLANAIPRLGVAPAVDEWGIYNDLGAYDEYDDAYIKYFADDFVYYPSLNDGWLMVPSGLKLTIWAGTESTNGWDDAYWSKDVWLLTNSETAAATFNYQELMLQDSGDPGDQADGYKSPPYYGLNLGSPLGWGNPVSDDPWADGDNEMFYFYTGVIEYNSTNDGDWFFAIWDINEDGKFTDGVDFFSPKTTSSGNHPYPIPEPTTMLLFGSGMFGMAALGRKRFLKGL